MRPIKIGVVNDEKEAIAEEKPDDPFFKWFLINKGGFGDHAALEHRHENGGDQAAAERRKDFSANFRSLELLRLKPKALCPSGITPPKIPMNQDREQHVAKCQVDAHFGISDEGFHLLDSLPWRAL